MSEVSMAPSAQLKQVQDNMFSLAVGERAAYAKPERIPDPTRVERTSPGQHWDRRVVHRVAVQCAATIGILSGLVGAVFLGGHVLLAREAQRSVRVSEMLNQQLERSRILRNTQARDITPTSISQKAGMVGMVHPDERDSIIVP
jgi:hypothetical protein